MLRLKQYQTEGPSLEARIDQLDVLIAAMESNAILADQQSTGTLHLGLESSFLSTEDFAEKTKAFFVEVWRKVVEFFKAMWEKLFGSDAAVDRSQASAQRTLTAVKEDLKEPAEVPEDQKNDIQKVLEGYKTEGTDTKIPEGLSEGLYQRLLRSHEMMFNSGPCAFANSYLRDSRYINRLMHATADLIKITLDYLKEEAKTAPPKVKGIPSGKYSSSPKPEDGRDVIDPFKNVVESSPSWKELKDLVSKTGVDWDGYDPRELSNARNAISNFVLKDRIPLNMDVNKAFTYGDKQITQAVHTLENSISETNKERSKSQSIVTKAVRDMKQLELSPSARPAVLYLNDLGAAYVNFARLRVMYSEHNKNYLEAVRAVNRHYARKKGQR